MTPKQSERPLSTEANLLIRPRGLVGACMMSSSARLVETASAYQDLTFPSAYLPCVMSETRRAYSRVSDP